MRTASVVVLAIGMVALAPISAFASTFHHGWVLDPDGAIHHGWVSLSRQPVAARPIYASGSPGYTDLTRPCVSRAVGATNYDILNNIPVPAVQLAGCGAKP